MFNCEHGDSGLLSLLRIASIENLPLDLLGGGDDDDDVVDDVGDDTVVCEEVIGAKGNAGMVLYADDRKAGCSDKSYDFRE